MFQVSVFNKCAFLIVVITLLISSANASANVNAKKIIPILSLLLDDEPETCIYTVSTPISAGAANSVSEPGSWPDSDGNGECISEKRLDDGDHYTAYYQFTLTEAQTLRVFLAAANGSETDTYMCLYDGHVTSGIPIAENDNGSIGLSGPNGTDSVITQFSMPAGDYTIEATTTLGSNSGFLESIDGDFIVTFERF